MMQPKNLLPGSLLLALLLVGCDQGQGPTEPAEPPEPTTESEAGAEATDVQTFAPDAEEGVGPFADRLPADRSQTILVPATDLFPGTAIIDPNIENPYAGDQEAIANGERHFEAFNCAGCHAPLGGGGMGPPLSDEKWIYGERPAQVFLSIMHGRPEGMPAWSGMLPEKTVWEIVAYIDTLDEIENYAAEKDFDENVGGFRDTDANE